MLHDLVFKGQPSGDLALVLDGGQRDLTFGELAAAVERFSDVLTAAGAGSGGVVAVSLSDGAAGLVALLAASAIGALPAPFAATWWPREARAAAENLAPDLIVADSTTSAALRDCAPQLLVGDGLGGLATAEPLDQDGDRLDRRVAVGETAALLASTAGVWGRPRSLELRPHQLVSWLADDEPAENGITVVASDLALLAAFRVAVTALGRGGAVALPGTAPRPMERLLLQLCGREEPVELLWTTGPTANRLGQHLRQRPASAPTPVRRLETAQGPLWPNAAQLFEDRLGVTVSASYTLTEAGGFVTRPAQRAPGPQRSLRVGSPRSELTVTIGADTEGHGQGCLSLAGDLLGTDRIDTTDMGRWTSDGLELAGRSEDCFVCDELPVWPLLVEAALSDHPGIADLAVARRPDPERGDVGVLVLVPSDPENPPFLDDLASYMEKLPAHARPSAQAVVDQLPLTPFGQVHRRMLGYEEASR